MWQFEHTETTRATPEQLWAHYADPATWPVWDDETESVTVEGPMAVGTRGRLKLLAPLFARVVGRNVAAGMPGAMRSLARLAEQ